MKKLSVLLVLFLMLGSILVSCTTPGKKPPKDNENDPPQGGEEPDNFIYDMNSKIYIVYDPEVLSREQIERIQEIFFAEQIYIQPRSKDDAPAEHEVIIGNVDRPAAKMAYTHLERLGDGDEVNLRYCFYSDGSSLAIAYDIDRENYCFEKILSIIKEKYVKEELILEKGTHDKEIFDLYDYLAEADQPYYQSGWEEVGQRAGNADLVRALKNLYMLYDGEKLINWISNLYDSDICVCNGLTASDKCDGTGTVYCGSGGFYYSNSARDNFGFLPDAESTVQALGFFDDCGIAAGVGKGHYVDVVPEWMGEQIVEFIYNLQNENGYFYHPQWGMSIGDSRRGRDLNWCNNILNAYGVKPKYKTPSDASAEGVSGNILPERLGSSLVTAVSKVIAVESTLELPKHLQSLDAFKTYVYGLDAYNKSYNAGHTLSSQLSQIKAVDARNGNTEYADFVIEHFNEIKAHHNNGTWHSEVNYFAVNGIMKVSGVYSGLGAEIPDAARTCLAAFNVVSSDETTDGIVDIWNAWDSVNRVLNNISDYSADGEATVAALREEILVTAPSAIDATRVKLSEYLKDDGSFSYTKKYSSATSQGVQAAVPNSEEGDVNATVIATNYMINSIFSSIGLGDVQVTICRTRERAMFYNIVENLSPVVKGGDVSIIPEPIDFEYDDIGESSDDVTIGVGATGTVEADPRGDGKVLHYVSAVYPGDQGTYNNNYLTINNMGVGQRAQIFEGDFCFLEGIAADDGFRIELGRDGDVNNAYRLTFRKSYNGELELWESSASSPSNAMINYLGVKADVGEWFNLRIEYYKGDHDNVRIKVFFNGKLCAVSDNYYDYTGIKLTEESTPKSDFRLTRFYSLNGERVSVLMDNLLSYVSSDAYVAEALHEDYAKNPYAINVDKIYDASEVYDFETPGEGGKYPDRITVNNIGSASVVTDGDNNALSLSGGSDVYVPVMKLTRDANCSVFSMKVDARAAVLGDLAKIALGESNKTNKTIIELTLSVGSESGKNYVYMKDSDGKTLSGFRFDAAEIAEVRVDFYEDERVALIYVNGEVRGLTALLSIGAKCIGYTRATVTSLGSGALIIDDLSASRTTKDYNEATAPKYNGKTYDFSDGLEQVEISGGVTLNNAALSVNTANNGSIKVPATNRDDVVCMSAFAFDLALTSMSKNGDLIEISFTDSIGRNVIAFVLRANNGTAELYEKTALGVHAKPIMSFSSSASLRFELFEVEGICKIYKDGVYSTETCLVYSKDNAKLSPAFGKITSLKTQATLGVDNISLDRVNKLYTVSAPSKPESKDAPVITFDYASGSSYSDKISYTINSAAEKPKVVEVDKNGKPDKAIRFETLKGTSMDILGIEKTVSASNAKSQVFETEFLMEKGESVPFQVWFWADNTIGMQLNIKVDNTDGSILFYHGNSQGTNVDTGVDIGEWLALRVETYFTDGKIVAKVLVNGELLYTVRYFNSNAGVSAEITLKDGTVLETANTTNGEKVVSGVTKVQFRALTSAEAVVYLDNISLSDSSKTYQ